MVTRSGPGAAQPLPLTAAVRVCALRASERERDAARSSFVALCARVQEGNSWLPPPHSPPHLPSAHTRRRVATAPPLSAAPTKIPAGS